MQPTSYTDALALVHDINYLIGTASSEKMAEADNIAIAHASFFSLQGLAMKIGLTFRKITHIKESEHLKDRIEYVKIGKQLRDTVLYTKEWASFREKYNITPDLFIS